MLPLLFLLAGCRSLPPQPLFEISGPGWRFLEGQAVWRSNPNAAGVAGDILVASHPDGRQAVQFTKASLLFLAAQRTSNAWQFHLVPRRKYYGGRGAPPSRLFWLFLPAALAGDKLPTHWKFQAKPEAHWVLENTRTGESLSGFFNPETPRP